MSEPHPEHRMEYSDKDLLLLFKEKEDTGEAFRLIVEKYQQKLYWHIRRILLDHDDSDDVIQETFLKAWKALPHFREESGLYTWLYRIATNEALRFLKKKKRRNLLSVSGLESTLPHPFDNDPYFSGDEIQKKLQQAVSLLPDKQRLVFQMKYMEEMKYEEMAEILNTSVGALKASYHHAVKKIEHSLQKD